LFATGDPHRCAGCLLGLLFFPVPFFGSCTVKRKLYVWIRPFSPLAPQRFLGRSTHFPLGPFPRLSFLGLRLLPSRVTPPLPPLTSSSGPRPPALNTGSSREGCSSLYGFSLFLVQRFSHLLLPNTPSSSGAPWRLTLLFTASISCRRRSRTSN